MPPFILAFLVAAIAAAGTARQEPPLAAVLARLDQFLARYEEAVAAVVAEEHYVQVLELTRADASLTRVLRSDYALARAPGGEAWTGYRDTFEVDGRPVRDREARLLALLADGTAGSARQALRITRENARYNLGEEVVARTINVPTVALDLIHPRHRRRMSFTRRDDAVHDGEPVWVLAFEERGRDTVLRTPDGRDRRVRGGVWLDPQTGEVLRTDLSWEGAPRGFISVRYRRDASIGAPVPQTMLEEYRGAAGMITGRASYTNYRRFTTDARLVAPGRP